MGSPFGRLRSIHASDRCAAVSAGSAGSARRTGVRVPKIAAESQEQDLAFPGWLAKLTVDGRTGRLPTLESSIVAHPASGNQQSPFFAEQV